jgi:hypothetical protein
MSKSKRLYLNQLQINSGVQHTKITENLGEFQEFIDIGVTPFREII